MKIKIIFIITSIIILIFLYTVKIRQPYFGKLTTHEHSFVTAQVLLMSKNIYRESLLNFVSLWNPKSIEFSDNNLKERDIHISFPPFLMIKIFLISKILNHEPSVSLLMMINLINSLLISLIISFSVFLIGKKILNINNNLLIFLFSITTGSIFLLTPASLYFFQNVYSYEQEVLLYFVLAILFEIIFYIRVISNKINNKKLYFDLSYFLIVLFGSLTEWFFYFFVIIALIVRGLIYFHYHYTINKNDLVKKTLINLLIPSFLSFFIYLTWVYKLDSINEIFERFSLRTSSLTDNGLIINNISKRIFIDFFPFAHGNLLGLFIFFFSLFLLFAFFFYVFFKNTTKKDGKLFMIFIVIIVLFPGIFYLYFFKNSTYIHEFYILRLTIPFCLISFGIFPLFLFSFLNDLNKKISFFGIKIWILITIFYLNSFSATKLRYFYRIKKNFVYETIDKFIEKNINYKDVIFSPNYFIGVIPPQQLSLTMKRVYYIEKPNDIYRFYFYNRLIEKKANINFLLLDTPVITQNKEFQSILKKNKNKIILKLPKEKFLYIKENLKEELKSYLLMKQIDKITYKKITEEIKNWNSGDVFLIKITVNELKNNLL